jgi:AraC-like DNA-binding protein
MTKQHSAPKQTGLVSISRFSTLKIPERERFELWVAGNHCDCRLQDRDSTPFNGEASGAALGSLILSHRKWSDSKRLAPYEVRRTARRIRTDGYDFFRFTMFLDRRFRFQTDNLQGTKQAGELVLLDAAQPQECVVESGQSISLVLPREFLPRQTEHWHGRTLSSGIGRLLADHLRSLLRNLPVLAERDVPFVVESTLQLLTAAVTPTADTVRMASAPIRDALVNRILRYIEVNLLEPDLTPDRICRDIGLSRAKLYQLFEGSGGVMRQIQRKRLRRVYRLLANPNRAGARIAEIAWRHGFSNEKYFYRLFKAEFGHTPNETVATASGGKPRAIDRDRGPAEIGRPFDWTLPFGMFGREG